MPARRLRLKCGYVFALVAGVLLVCATVQGQTRGSSVTLTGTISETVALSTLPTFTLSGAKMDVVSSGGNTLRITLSGDNQAQVIRVPLLVRSNSGFKLSAVFESNTTEVAQLSVIDVDATGNLVSPHLLKALDVRSLFDPEISQPLLVLSGPRVSLGGTLESPNNALQLALLIRLTAQPARDWLVHLTLVASPESRVQ